MSKKFYPASFDYVFKRIFGDQRNIHILKAFLIAALDLPEEEFDRLEIIDPHLKREFHDDKMGILDVKVYHKSGVVINVEVQVEISQDLRKRIAFSIGKMLSEQIQRGDEYYRIERVVCIVICGGVLLSEEPEYYNTYSLRNARSGREFTDVMEINILEPEKLPSEPDDRRLFNWGQFFKAETPEELTMIADKDPAIKEAAALVMELNEDDAERMLADARWRWQMDHAALERKHYREGQEEAETRFKPVIDAINRENEAISRENEAKNREIAELRRKLREAGIDD
ncbi:MAG: Rpn family recombination-promoting nuclease/putative transposase [Treponema sp.]|jgi:predicted transposase/invertase (TIGR01784 family)|nr:Rpn family recombination-promoting nuclease/putative transposase [Treponema sp.]